VAAAVFCRENNKPKEESAIFSLLPYNTKAVYKHTKTY